MQINKISVSTNFGVNITNDAMKELRNNGISPSEENTISGKIPLNAIIDIEKANKTAYITGDHTTISLPPGEKLTMQSLTELCKAFNREKFFSALKKAEKKPVF